MTDEGTAADEEAAAMVDQIRRRYEQDGLMLAGTVRKRRPEVLHRAATLALEEMQAGPTPATWETARTRPYASEELDDPRDVLIGRLAAILGVVDGGYHPASYPAMLAAARELQSKLSSFETSDRRRRQPDRRC
ncbi:hypothetical protein [Actinomycetospora corticicola]|uniref:Uncharacterized protein n=1 Tax=Actinomycetospora corticicola TaxID=663602 RepID=A0A7Y9J7M6_9PSEU|nr:hypothetical protein [Actinomycetospora corticicola]NYD38560.1 hypothetical protein [Actinomycetospora corticicola]